MYPCTISGEERQIRDSDANAYACIIYAASLSLSPILYTVSNGKCMKLDKRRTKTSDQSGFYVLGVPGRVARSVARLIQEREIIQKEAAFP